MAEEKTATQEDVIKAWSRKAGRQDQYDLVEVEGVDGETQTQLIDKDTGSITVAVDGTGGKVLQKLVDKAGDLAIDGAVTPKESAGVASQKRYTSRGVIATPTQPEVLVDNEPVEVDNRKPVEKRENSEPQAPVFRQPSQEEVVLGEDKVSKTETKEKKAESKKEK